MDPATQETGGKSLHAKDIWFHGVMVSTLDSESSDPSSNLGGTFLFTENDRQDNKARWMRNLTGKVTPKGGFALFTDSMPAGHYAVS